jgi:hypothetical protein
LWSFAARLVPNRRPSLEQKHPASIRVAVFTDLPQLTPYSRLLGTCAEFGASVRSLMTANLASIINIAIQAVEYRFPAKKDHCKQHT